MFDMFELVQYMEHQEENKWKHHVEGKLYRELFNLGKIKIVVFA